MVGATVTNDPYVVLQMPHSATEQEIKNAYRAMARKYHPDRFVTEQHDEKERQQASLKFTECAAAYALLSDKQRKAEYDHVYKYGGFDGIEVEDHCQTQSYDQQLRPTNNERTMGIGYTCYDPCTFLWAHGRIESRRTMAGVQLPTTSTTQRTTKATMPFGMVTLSTGRTMTCRSTGATTFVSETKQYYPFEKRIRTIAETVTLHADGRQDVAIEEGEGNHHNNFNDQVKRRHEYKTFSTMNHNNHRMRSSEFPWYMHAWKKVHDKFAMCYNPCASVRDE